MSSLGERFFWYPPQDTLIGLLSHVIFKHSCRSQHISVLINYLHIFMFRQVFTIEPSSFKTISRMHRRPFKCRHLF